MTDKAKELWFVCLENEEGECTKIGHCYHNPSKKQMKGFLRKGDKGNLVSIPWFRFFDTIEEARKEWC